MQKKKCKQEQKKGSFTGLTPYSILTISWAKWLDWGDSYAILKVRDRSAFGMRHQSPV